MGPINADIEKKSMMYMFLSGKMHFLKIAKFWAKYKDNDRENSCVILRSKESLIFLSIHNNNL